MKYQKWYYQIIEHARNNPYDGYTETHHILPKSLGGNDASENIVNLSARQHFICHWLLTKFTSGNDRIKMIYALRMMRAKSNKHQRYSTDITSRVYEKLKKEYSVYASQKVSGEKNGMYGKSHTQETIDKIRKANIGRIQPLHENIKQKEAMTGRKRDEFSEEWRRNLSNSRIGDKNHMYGKCHSDETKEKIRDKAIGRIVSVETREKLSKAAKGTKRERKVCEHCGKNIAINIYSKNHGSNCKSKL